MPTRTSSALLSLIAATALPFAATAQQFTPGNLVASTGGRLYELDANLQVVRTLQVPPPDGGRYDVVDVVVDPLGRAHVLLTGVGSPGSIATFDPQTGSWTQHPVAAFLGNVSDGDLSIVGSFLFTKSQRIELPGYTATSIQLGGRGVGEISAGLDGRVFALDSGSPRPGIRVVDPDTLLVIDSFSLPFLSDSRGISSLPNGELVVADWNGTITRYTPDGQTALASLATGANNLYDVEVTADGRIAAGSRFGDVVLTDAQLNSQRSVVPGSTSQGVYVAFVPQLGPNVSEVVPAGGSWRGPDAVEIRGRFFTGATISAVRFAGAPATAVTVIDDNTIRCTPPAGVPGPVDVTIDNPIATATLPDGFVYTPGLAAPETVAPGGTLVLEFWLERPGDFIAALVGTPSAPPVTIPGIDFSGTLGAPAVLLMTPSWPTSTLPVVLRLPDDASLLGAEGGFQAVSGVTGRASWTNAATVRVQR